MSNSTANSSNILPVLIFSSVVKHSFKACNNTFIEKFLLCLNASLTIKSLSPSSDDILFIL